jgi:hypothetical protein
MEFNHSKDNLIEALGFKEESIEDLGARLTDIVNETVSGDNPKTSHLAQKIAENLSYSELVFVATQHMMDKVKSFNEIKRKEISKMLKEVIKGLKDSLEDRDL